MRVDYVDHMGTDLSVINAARVSFDKTSEYLFDEEGRNYLKTGDMKLIKYLADKKHWSPFAHAQISLRIKAPVFVARQLVKHQVGLAWNEVSRRYVDTPPDFFMPDEWRLKAENIKQGSSAETIESFTAWDGCLNAKPSFLDEIIAVDSNQGEHCEQCGDTTRSYTYSVDSIAQHVYTTALEAYNLLIEEGVCPEQARMLLPVSHYTEWQWTGSLYAFSRVCKLRLDSHTQKETRLIAERIQGIIETLYPVSWEALMNAVL